jgi:O-antigen/teichoic acid export membrane protein
MARETLVTVSAWAARAVQTSVQLVIMHLLVRQLGTEQYSVLVVLQSLVPWFALTEFGLGPSVQNAISRGKSAGDNGAEAVAGALILGSVGLVVSLVAVVLLAEPVGSFLLRRFALEVGRSGKLVLLVGLFSVTAAVGGISYRVLYAHQKGYLSHVYQAGSSLITLFWVLSLARAGTAQLASVLASVTVPPMLAAIAATVHVLTAQPWCSPRAEVIQRLLRDARGFMLFALFASTVLQVDYIVMSQVLVAREILEYTVLNRVFMLAFFLYNAALMALWPTVSELYHGEHFAEIQVYSRRYLTGGFALVAMTTIVFLGARGVIVNLLAPGTNITLRTGTLLLFGAYLCLRVWSDMFSMLLQCAGHVQPLLLIVLLQGLLSVTLQTTLAPLLGVEGILLGLTLTFCATSVWFGPWRYRRLLKRGKGEAEV